MEAVHILDGGSYPDVERDILMLGPYALNKVHCGDALECLRRLPDECVDAVVTDPPYGLKFMGKHWDCSVPKTELWSEMFRVLKPGAHLLAFFGTRTYHRGVVAIEDAGFEVRDQLAWVYGSGFPKSLDVSKAIDREAGVKREISGIRKGRGTNNGEGRYNWNNPSDKIDRTTFKETAPATDAARQWDGWGTALKPAWEPICMARKPLTGTVAENVLEHGTGAINVDGCRVIIGEGREQQQQQERDDHLGNVPICGPRNGGKTYPTTLGRWPANLVHDGSEEVLECFPESGSNWRPNKSNGKSSIFGSGHSSKTECPDDTGSSARFFYSAKADAEDRGPGNDHPTVKPTDLMRWLVRLVTPPGGIVLDPFSGSGSTGVAAIQQGFRFLGFDREEKYAKKIASPRLAAAERGQTVEQYKAGQLTIFDNGKIGG